MIDVDPLFSTFIKESYVVSCHVDVIKVQLVEDTLTQTLVATNVGIINGSVSADSSANARRSCQMKIPIRADNTYYDTRDPLTNNPQDLPLNVVDTQIRVFSGVQIGSRTFKVPMGVFRVDEVKRRNNDALDVNGTGLEAYVIENVATKTTTYPKTDSVLSRIELIIKDAIPYANIDVDEDVVDTTLGSDLVRDVNSSPWGAVEILATKIDSDVFCGPDGRFKVKRKRSLENTVPVYTVEAGSIHITEPPGTLTELNGGVTRADTYNAVVVMGQSSDPEAEPVSYVLKLDESEGYEGPLKWGGPFGKKPRVMGQNPVLTTVAACQAAARTYIKRYQALSRTLDISMVPNPALEPDDVIRIDMLDGTFENHMIKKIDMPLGVSGAWKIETMSTKDQLGEEEEGGGSV